MATLRHNSSSNQQQTGTGGGSNNDYFNVISPEPTPKVALKCFIPNRRLEVWSENHDTYFVGTLKAVDDHRSDNRPHCVVYDVTEREWWLDLNKERFRWLDVAHLHELTLTHPTDTSTYHRPTSASAASGAARGGEGDDESTETEYDEEAEEAKYEDKSESSWKEDSDPESSDDSTIKEAKLTNGTSVRVGNQIKVWWKETKSYVAGEIIAIRNRGRRTICIQYNKEKSHNINNHSSECEWLDLNEEDWSKVGGASNRRKGRTSRVNSSKDQKAPVRDEEDEDETKMGDEGVAKGPATEPMEAAKEDSESVDKHIAAIEEQPPTPTSTAAKESDPQPALSDVTVGSRVEIWWEDDSCYYAGVVTKVKDNDGTRFFVEYDDGDLEWVDLGKEKFRLLPSEDGSDSTSGRLVLAIGTRVEVLWDDGKYYAGTIKRRHPHKNWHFVEYDDGESIAWLDLLETEYRVLKEDASKPKKQNPQAQPRKYRKSDKKKASDTAAVQLKSSASSLNVGDRVNIWSDGEETYYPATITNERRDRKDRFFIKYDNGEEEWIDLDDKKCHKLSDCGSVSTTPAKNVRDPRSELSEFEFAENGERPMVQVGSRIEIWWPLDKKFYSGVVKKERANNKKNFCIEYDDGDHEWLDLETEHYRIPEYGAQSDDASISSWDGGSEESSVSEPARRPIASRKPKSYQVQDEENSNTNPQEEDTIEKGGEKLVECPDLSLVKVGSRVAVWWASESRYYAGTVKRKKRRGVKKNTFLNYDDGDKEWVNLHAERFRLLLPLGSANASPARKALSTKSQEVPQLVIGSTISAWWDIFEAFFDATVLQKHRCKDNDYLVRYESGLECWMDVSKHNVRVENPNFSEASQRSSPVSESNDSETIEQVVSKKKNATWIATDRLPPKKKRCEASPQHNLIAKK